MRKTISLVIVLSSVLLLSQANATDYYVRPAGTTYGSGNGTSYANAWSGFSAINWTSVANGNGILWIDGVHSETLTVGASGKAGYPVYAKGYSASVSLSGVQITTKDYVTIDGIIAENSSGNGMRVDGVSRNIVIKNCTIRNNVLSGIGTWDTTHYSSLTVDSCLVYHNGSVTTHNNGIYFMGGSVIIRNCTIYNNGWNASAEPGLSQGIYIGEHYAGGGPQSAEIYNNTIYNHPYGAGVRLKNGANVYNNTIYGNQDGGIALASATAATTTNIHHNKIYGNIGAGAIQVRSTLPSATVNIYNNSTYQNGTGGTGQWYAELYIDLDVATIKVNNNILVSRSGNSEVYAVSQSSLTADYNILYGGPGSSLYQGPHGYHVDPKYVNPPSDMTLQSSSPGISINAGAYASGSAPPPPSPPPPPPPTGLFPAPPTITGVF